MWTLETPRTTASFAGRRSHYRLLSSSHSTSPDWRRPSAISFVATKSTGPLSSTVGRITVKISYSATEAVFEVGLASTKDNGTHGDSSMGLNLYFLLNLIILLFLMRATPSKSSYGSLDTTRAVSRNKWSTH